MPKFTSTSQPPPRGGALAGTTVAALLRGAWRARPGPPGLPGGELARALRDCEPLLLGSGCGPLVWQRLANGGVATLAAASPYRDAQRYHAARAGAERLALAAVVRTLAEIGVEPLLVKGWATARYYPAPGLRPFGDVDLVVGSEQRSGVEQHLLERRRATPALALAPVDLHVSLADLADRPLDELRSRAVSVPLGDASGTAVRVLGGEDHLRLLALHLLRHGAWRPLWLCDVALLVETLGEALDWDLCLRGSREDARRVALVIGLAHRLLGAALPGVLPRRAARAARAVPRWVVRATLRQWGRPYERYSDDPLLAAVPRPGRLLAAARRRWPNPIEATVSVGASFGGAPRLPFQVADVVRRAGRALLHAS